MSVAINFVKPTPAAIQTIADTMRDADRVEVWESHRLTPHQALEYGLKLSDYAVVVEADGVPVAAFGLTKECVLTGAGVPWMLTSSKSLNYKREFLLQSPAVVAEMLNICPRLSNYVHADNRVSIRWLKWLGFTIDEPMPVGVNKALFHRFHFERV